MKILRLFTLGIFAAALALSQSAGVMPIPEQQFFDANGLPLNGGSIYTCVAGESCPGNPLASYTDASGTTANTNPVVLDSGGRASIWLSGSAYKIVAEDASGNVVWTADNVTIPGLSLLSGTGTLSALTVTGDATIGGTLGVTGDATFSGDISVSGALSAGSLSVTGNTTVGGTLAVTGATTLTGNTSVTGTLGVTGATTLAALTAAATTVSSLTVGSQTLAEVIDAAIAAGGSPAAIDGTVVISAINLDSETDNGAWVIFTFGTVSGTRVRIALGSGNVTNGTTIAVPSGFSVENMFATASPSNLDTSGNDLRNMTVSVSSSGVVTSTASDNDGNNFNPTANWFAVAWETGY